MIYNIWKRTDSAVSQYLIPNSKREKYIEGLKDDKGAALYIKIGTTGGDTPITPTPPVGGGDMLKETYDTNKNNIVDRAERADAMSWTGDI